MSESKYATSPPAESKELTKEEKDLVERLRQETKSDPCNITTSDDTLIRFVRGYSREKDPANTTVQRYKDMLKWRAENKVDNVILNNPPDHEKYNELYHGFIYGHDLIGRPVCYEQLGKLDPESLMKFGMDKLESGHIRHMEELTKRKFMITREKGNLYYKHIHIIDLQGFGWKHMGTKFYGTIKKLMGIDSHFYPETLQKLFIINSSYMFRTLWAVISPWVHPLTKKRISLLGYDVPSNLKAMQEFIHIDQIPEYLGGKNKAPMKGICNIKFEDIDYSTEPPTWKKDSKDPRAIYVHSQAGPSGAAPPPPK